MAIKGSRNGAYLLGKSWAHLRRRSLVDVLLGIIAIVSTAAVLLSYEDPFFRIVVCNHIGFCPTFAHAWYKLIYDLGVGALVSFFFYYLVVRLPDYLQRQRLKRSLELRYRAFRLNCIEIMLSVAGVEFQKGQAEALLDPEKFKDFFKEKVAPKHERWYDFVNNLTEFNLERFQTLLAELRDEIIFILNNTDIPKDEPFEFLKRLSVNMYSMKAIKIDDWDELKSFARFLWEMFAGWDLIEGYRKEDIVQKMIDEI